MIRFRIVKLDDNDKIEEVLYESEVEYKNRFDLSWNDTYYQLLHKLNKEYDFNNWEFCPLIETHRYENGEWCFESNTIEDYYNL